MLLLVGVVAELVGDVAIKWQSWSSGGSGHGITTSGGLNRHLVLGCGREGGCRRARGFSGRAGPHVVSHVVVETEARLAAGELMVECQVSRRLVGVDSGRRGLCMTALVAVART